MGAKLKTIWKNRNKIFEGVWNTWFPKTFIEKIAKRRTAICELNRCGFYDALGVSEKAVMKGKPTCSSCGCRIEYKTRVLSVYCSLGDIRQEPLWNIEMTEKEEKKFRDKTGVQNDI